jgi:hypothetical protein
LVLIAAADAMRALPPVATTADWPSLWIHHKSEEATWNGSPFHSRKFMKLRLLGIFLAPASCLAADAAQCNPG